MVMVKLQFCKVYHYDSILCFVPVYNIILLLSTKCMHLPDLRWLDLSCWKAWKVNHQPASPQECPTCLHVPKLGPTMLWFTQNQIHLGLCHKQWDNQITTAYVNKRIIQNWESQWSDIFRRHVEIREIPMYCDFGFLKKEAIFFLHKEMQMYIFCVVFSE